LATCGQDGWVGADGRRRSTNSTWHRNAQELKVFDETYLSRIAEKLELPTKGSTEDTRQIIERKLLEMGREPRNIQIELEFREEEEFLLLRDADGVFVEVEPHVQELSKSGSGSESGEGEPETVAETTVEVETLSQNEALLSESKCLQDELKREKERVREIWKMNSWQGLTKLCLLRKPRSRH